MSLTLDLALPTYGTVVMPLIQWSHLSFMFNSQPISPLWPSSASIPCFNISLAYHCLASFFVACCTFLWLNEFFVGKRQKRSETPRESRRDTFGKNFLKRTASLAAVSPRWTSKRSQICSLPRSAATLMPAALQSCRFAR